MLGMKELCSEATVKGSPKGCDTKRLTDKHWTLQLFESASAKSRKMGELSITASEAGLFVLRYKDPAGQETTFDPDEYDSDWSYGPYFNHTVVQKNGHWLLLPQSPFPKAVWINLTLPAGKGLGLKGTDANGLINSALDSGSIYITSDSISALQSKTKKPEILPSLSSIYIEAIRAGKVIFRMETDADMACGEEVEASKAKPLLYEASLKDMFDANGHMVLRTKYTRGC
jgi:hypothetical protein